MKWTLWIEGLRVLGSGALRFGVIAIRTNGLWV